MADGDYLGRTAITRLSVSPDQADLLEDTIDEWRTGANIATDIGWEHYETRKRKLQSLAYDDVRDQTRLGSQHAILACFQAIALSLACIVVDGEGFEPGLSGRERDMAETI